MQDGMIPTMTSTPHGWLSWRRHLLTTGIPGPGSLGLRLALHPRRGPCRSGSRAGSGHLHDIHAASSRRGSRSSSRGNPLVGPEHDWKEGIDDEEEGLLEERTERDSKPSGRRDCEIFDAESGCCTEESHGGWHGRVALLYRWCWTKFALFVWGLGCRCSV